MRPLTMKVNTRHKTTTFRLFNQCKTLLNILVMFQAEHSRALVGRLKETWTSEAQPSCISRDIYTRCVRTYASWAVHVWEILDLRMRVLKPPTHVGAEGMATPAELSPEEKKELITRNLQVRPLCRHNPRAMNSFSHL